MKMNQLNSHSQGGGIWKKEQTLWNDLKPFLPPEWDWGGERDWGLCPCLWKAFYHKNCSTILALNYTESLFFGGEKGLKFGLFQEAEAKRWEFSLKRPCPLQCDQAHVSKKKRDRNQHQHVNWYGVSDGGQNINQMKIGLINPLKIDVQSMVVLKTTENQESGQPFWLF